MTMILNNLIVGKKYDVKDDYMLLDPTQLPLLSMLGYGKDATQTEHKWLEDSMFSDKTLINGAVTDVALSVVVDDVEPFMVDSVAQIGNEWLLITAINEGTKTLTVTRGYADTTAAAHADDSVIEFKFANSKEGQEAREARYKERVEKSNFTQIFTDSVNISGSAQAVDQYGVANEYNKERMKKETEIFLQLEKACTSGVKYKNSDGSIRFIGGMKNWITTNVINGGAVKVTYVMLRTMTKTVELAGGFKRGKAGYVFMMHPTQLENVSDIMVASNGNQERSDTTRGYTVGQITTPQGTFPVVSNSNLEETEILFVDKARMEIKPLTGRALFHKFLGEMGDFIKGMLIGEYTFEFVEEKAHARLYNLAK